MNRGPLESTEEKEQRDLVVQIQRSLTVAALLDKVVEKEHGLLGFISQGIEYISRKNDTAF